VPALARDTVYIPVRIAVYSAASNATRSTVVLTALTLDYLPPLGE
jgi:hypothetical protein